MTEVAEIRSAFLERQPLYDRLAEEVTFAINSALLQADLKVHAVLSRVKTLDGFLEKIERKSYQEPFAEMSDVVGVRVVCLFLSDLPKVRAILVSLFELLTEEDKVESEDVASFGYMSIHYTCRLGKQSAGPRYDALKNIAFEVQVRTIVMDAWANISHHLAYKGEASIPQPLRRDFHALSGLFYVADQHFELFVRESIKSERIAARDVATATVKSNLGQVELNADTLMAFIRSRFPDRVHASKAKVSEYAEALIEAGYTTVGDVDDALKVGEMHALVMEEHEQQSAGVNKYRLADIGVVNVAIRSIDPAYEAAVRLVQRRRMTRHAPILGSDDGVTPAP